MSGKFVLFYFLCGEEVGNVEDFSIVNSFEKKCLLRVLMFVLYRE